MGVDAETIATYNRAAKDMAAHFQGYGGGAMRTEVERSFDLAGSPKDARVVEIGCGAGKDAAEIIKIAVSYQGFDPSAELLTIAREHVPNATFAQSDAVNYEYPKGLDIVFAFASMLHLDKEEFAVVCRKVSEALKPGGIFCMTLKETDNYQKLEQEDDFGVRRFFLYTPELVRELAGEVFEQVYEHHEVVGPKAKPWFTIILKRR